MRSIEITTAETDGIDRVDEPVTVGVPIPEGMIKDVNSIMLFNEKQEGMALQAEPLAFWPDKSVKWLLLDFQASVPAKSRAKYQLVDGQPVEIQGGINHTKNDSSLVVDTDATTFYIDNKLFRPFKKVLHSGADVIEGDLAVCEVTTDEGVIYEPVIDTVSAETEGKLRSTFRIEGDYKNGKNTFLQFTARLHFYFKKSAVKIELTLRNPGAANHSGGRWDLGDSGSALFKKLNITIPLKNRSANQINYCVEGGAVLKGIEGDNVSVYQDSSGGENWRSMNHNNRNRDIPLAFKGFKVMSGDTILEAGLRAVPTVFAGEEGAGISAVIKNFWQNFPKAISANKDGILLGLFPEQFSDLYELQGGEQKTHVVFLDFSGADSGLNGVHAPLRVRCTPQWYAESGAFPYLTADADDNEYNVLIDAAVQGDKSFIRKREVIDEYGWRNFGEIYADHEAVGHEGPDPLISHYNNQYDPVYGMQRQFAVRSDDSWYELMNDLAHHVVDIDIYHTNEDRDEYNGGMFWHTDHYLDAGTATHRSFTKDHIRSKGEGYGGGPGLEHCYTTGLMFHYYLTGEVASKEAVLEVAGWVMRSLSCSTTFLGALHKFKKKILLIKRLLKGKQIPFIKYPFTRGTGNAINTLLDSYLITGDRDFINTVEELITGCISPENIIEDRALLNAEVAWSYTVCLHSVGRYLDVKKSMGETDEIYCYARDSLLHYARWMRDYEYPYLDKPEILEFPNETWPAQDIRKSNVFYYAYKYANTEEREVFLEKAKFFYEYTIKTLLQFETRTHTRPIVLLLQNYGMHHYFIQHCDSLPVHNTPCRSIPTTEEYWSLKTLFTHLAEDLMNAFKNTSFSKEIKWLKLRLNSK